MNNEIESIIQDLERVNSGDPWFGKSVYALLEEVNATTAFIKPNNSEHSAIELLYHLITWAGFTLARLEKDHAKDAAYFDNLDWRKIDPSRHSWEKGLAEFKQIHKMIIARLRTNSDEFLNETVDYRKYNFRYLLHGLIQHNIYHAGQIAYLRKLLG